MQDIGGDGFFFATIRSYRHKGWVDAMFVPYTVLFALAAIVSLVSLLVNGRILLLRCRQNGVAFVPGPLGSRAMSDLKSKFDLHRFERWRHICGLLLGLLEDLPLGAPLFPLLEHQPIGSGLYWLDTVCAVAGTMNSLFVIRSVIECVDLATGAKSTISSTCDLQSGQLALMLLSLLTSALMLGMKLASVEIVRLKQQEMSRMEAEHDRMLRELQEELQEALGSREEAHEVAKVFTARRSRLSRFGPNSILPSPVAAPTDSSAAIDSAVGNVPAGPEVAAAFRACLASLRCCIAKTIFRIRGWSAAGTLCGGNPDGKCA